MPLTRFFTVAIAGLSTCAALVLSGCDNSILEATPRDQLSNRAVFADPNLAEASLNDIYRGVGHGLNGTTLWSLTDDGHNTRFGGTTQHMQSLITPSSLGTMGGGRFDHYLWGPLYKSIRNTNIFLTQIDSATFDETRRLRMKGEAFFLRAYFYHNLLRIYGGVPIIKQVYELDDDFVIARNSFEQTVEAVVADADSAAALLPVAQSATALGRATKGAALTLKARTLMYAASDLANLNPGRLPETGYTTPGDRAAKWRRAQAAAKSVIDLGVYSLFRGNPAQGENTADNYAALWLNPTNSEVIFGRYFLASRGTVDIPNVGRYDGPNGYHNWGSNTPTQNLGDAYRMADGSKFSWNNPVHAASPYANRDPRFYATIHFDGSKWVPRPSDAVALDPVGIIQTFTKVTLPNGNTVPGLDSRAGPIENWNGTYSGYYKRKAINPAVDHQFVSQEVPWYFFRYAEVLFDYAEASIELGDEAAARSAINQVRRRAGMPAIDGAFTGAALRDEYRNERRIELVFEEQRYFDARRWMIAPQAFGEAAHGIDITAQATNALDRSTYRNYTYKLIDVEPRAWNDRMYFNPIPRDEMNRNSLLKQNPGY